jgi:NitT/TauT family transport system permease protein
MNLESSAPTLDQVPATSPAGAQADQRPAHRVRGAAFYTVVRALSVVSVLGTWEVLGAQINPIFLSTPTRIAVALFNLVRTGELLEALRLSLLGLVIGLPRPSSSACQWAC